MSRMLANWLDSYVEYTKETEPPASYHLWVGTSIIAGALQRRVVLDWGFERIYPNMYIILVGPSGRARKGVALGIGKDLLKDVGVSLTAEAPTRESLIRRMKDKTITFTTPTGRIVFHCSMTCFSEELSVFLGQNDIRFLSNLTDWYDSKDDWTYDTKNQGIDHLQGLCFNLLGATAPDWFQSILPTEAIGGGFTSRIIFVVEERKGKTVPEDITPPKKLRDALVHDLERMTTLSGQFSFDPTARRMYTDWYSAEDEKLNRGILPVKDNRLSAYCERRATHLRKLMMVLSIARDDELVITADDVTRAAKQLVAAEANMHKTFSGFGSSPISGSTDRIITYIKNLGEVPRSVLMRTFYRDIDADTLDNIERTLHAMNRISIQNLSSGEKLYKWITDADAAEDLSE